MRTLQQPVMEIVMLEKKIYCHCCGKRLSHRFTEGRQRLFCENCRRPIYENPIPATCLVVVNAKGQLLLVKRSVAPQKGQWCLPGGFIELGEQPDKGALRELLEETGLAGDIDRLLGLCTTPSPQYDSVLMAGYLVTRFEGQAAPGDDAAEIGWFTYPDIPSIAFASHQSFIDQYFQEQQILP